MAIQTAVPAADPHLLVSAMREELAKPGTRALLVTEGDANALAFTPVAQSESVLNVSEELTKHLDASPHTTEFLVNLRNYCEDRLQARAGVNDPNTPPIDIDRRVVGMECTWEMDALILQCLRTTDGLTADDDGSVLTDRLLLRGLCARMKQLNSALMSVLGDGGVSTSQLEKVVVQADYVSAYPSSAPQGVQ